MNVGSNTRRESVEVHNEWRSDEKSVEVHNEWSNDTNRCHCNTDVELEWKHICVGRHMCVERHTCVGRHICVEAQGLISFFESAWARSGEHEVESVDFI